MNKVLEVEEVQELSPAFESETLQFAKAAIHSYPADWIIGLSSIQRFAEPAADVSNPVEYAFHLLGDVRGKTVIDLRCHAGMNTVTLGLLGANVLSVDSSRWNLSTTAKRVNANDIIPRVTLVQSNDTQIPIGDGRADLVLWAGGLRQSDCLTVARQIRRILKPGGVAVFIQRAISAEQVWPLTRKRVEQICRAVGRPGRFRAFPLSILRLIAGLRGLSSSLVWEARKEC